MAGLAQIALGSAPVFGGALLAVAAGQFRGPNHREQLKLDMDLLDRLPPEAASRRAELQHAIDIRIDDLIEAGFRGRAMRKAAESYEGNWRDLVLLLCVLLFTYIWWDIGHNRPHWMVTFILLIVLAVITAAYALRGILRAVGVLIRRRRHPHAG